MKLWFAKESLELQQILQEEEMAFLIIWSHDQEIQMSKWHIVKHIDFQVPMQLKIYYLQNVHDWRVQLTSKKERGMERIHGEDMFSLQKVKTSTSLATLYARMDEETWLGKNEKCPTCMKVKHSSTNCTLRKQDWISSMHKLIKWEPIITKEDRKVYKDCREGTPNGQTSTRMRRTKGGWWTL